MPLRLERLGDAARFEADAGAFLRAREAENNLVLGLIAGLKAGRTFGPQPPYFAVVRDRQRVVAAAMRTPPHNLILTAGSEPDALPFIVDDAHRAMPDTTGVVGPKALAARAIELWSARTGTSARRVRAERIYQLTAVVPPRPASGAPRVARAGDRPTIVDWFQAFVVEAMPDGDTSRANAEDLATHWIRGGGLWVWVDGGLVAMAGVSGPTPNGIRVGAVYTAPQKRGRGYASSLVAALSQAQLDAGRRFCFLYTDLSNPTSNKIYQALGYEPVCDVDEYRFEVTPPRPERFPDGQAHPDT